MTSDRKGEISGARINPGARIDQAIEAMRAEAMQAIADAAMQIGKTSNLSMRTMIAGERARLGLSLQEVADRAGITKSHMWELEQGRAVLGIPFVSMAAGAMNDAETPYVAAGRTALREDL